MIEAQTNLALATELYDRFSAGDIAGILAMLSEDVVWELVGPAEIPYFGTYRGVAEVERFFELLGQELRVHEFRVDRVIGTDTGALAEGFERGQFVGSVTPYEMRWCHVLDIEDGQIVGFTDHLDTAPMVDSWRNVE